MSDAQRLELRSRRSERDDSRQDPNRIAAASVAASIPPPPPQYHLPYPPSVVHLPPPPPPMHIGSVTQGNRQHPNLVGPRGQAPAGYPPSVSGSYGAPPLVYPGYPPFY
jgi:hypothetical protein